ncbi:redoxin domain-containing protein [Akkermansia glycaniphila]|uniref:thioredoxin-like domain-containing protein n=1 Tax=Akkermansia glycaniphila TaxID=1679444 RepID=UPI001C028D1F|nr:thioredoxin-like domain-containing protein [Akkermansia glycaniphila]MBT9448979.1 redoxin domain-containing protein [Akkermansia glycaniphila]
MKAITIISICCACTSAFAFAQDKPAAATTPAAATAPAAGASKLGAELKPGLGLTDGKWGEKTPNTKAEYYIAYYSASWCPPCRNLAPHSVEGYNKHIAGQDKVELISISFDQTPQAAKAWAEKEKMPWVIYPRDKAPEFAMKHAPNGIPTMKLIGPDGKVIAEGRDIAQLMSKVPAK